MSWEPTVTPVAYHTQRLGNQFPYWHAARRIIAGTSQRVMNALAGFHMDQFMARVALMRANGHLSTTDVSEPHKIWVCKRPLAVKDHQEIRNLLDNPAFHRINPWRLGAWAWGASLSAATGDMEVRTGKGLFGYHAIRLTADVGETITLDQTVLRPMASHEDFVVSCWYAGIRPAASLTDPQVDGPILRVTVTYVNGATQNFDTFLNPATDGDWTRSHVLCTPSNVVHSVRVRIIVTPIDGEKAVLDIGGLQLETGVLPGPWTEDLDGALNMYLVYPKVSYTESTTWGNVTYNRQAKIAIVDRLDYSTLAHYTPPNRGVVSASAGEVGVSKTVLGAEVDPSGAQFSVGWRVAGGQVERFNADNTQNEVWYSLGVADLYGDGTTEEVYRDPAEYSITQVIEAVTVARQWLYVVVKETWNSRTSRVLKICHPHVRWKDLGFLESVQDIPLDNGSGTCTAVGLVDDRIDKVLFTVGGTDFVLDLFWDVAAGTQDGMVVLRSDPGDAMLVA